MQIFLETEAGVMHKNGDKLIHSWLTSPLSWPWINLEKNMTDVNKSVENS